MSWDSEGDFALTDIRYREGNLKDKSGAISKIRSTKKKVSTDTITKDEVHSVGGASCVSAVEDAGISCATNIGASALSVSGTVGGGGEGKCRSVDIVLGEKEKCSVGGAGVEFRGAEGGVVEEGEGGGNVEVGAEGGVVGGGDGAEDIEVGEGEVYDRVPQMSKQRLKEIRRHLSGKGECCWYCCV